MARVQARNMVIQDNGDGILQEGAIPVLANAAAIKAIAAVDLFDGYAVYDATTMLTYVYDAQATQADYATSVEPHALKATNGTGMFFVSGGNSMVLIDPIPLRVINKSGVDIAQYDEVYVNGFDTVSGLLQVAGARANALGTAATVRTALTAIQNTKVGYVAKELVLINQDTSTATGGGYGVYLSDAVVGARLFDGSAPTASNTRHIVGRVITKHATAGVVHIYHENRQESHNHADAARGTQLTATAFTAGGITADATGRAIFAAGLFDNATVESVIAAGAIGASAASRALFANNFWTTAETSGAGSKFAAGCFNAAGLTNVLAADAITAAVWEAAAAAGAISATVDGRASIAANFFDDATLTDKIANDAITAAVWEAKAAAGAISATVDGRASMAANYFDAATLTDKVAADAITAAVWEAKAAAGAISATVDGRASLAANFFDTATLTDKIAASAFTTAHFSGANIKFAAGALDTAGADSFIAAGAVQPAKLGLVVWNATGGAFAIGDLVYVSGWNAANSLPQASIAQNDASGQRAQYVCIAVIGNGASGMVVKKARVQNVTTVGAVGSPIYLSETGATTTSWTEAAPALAGRGEQIVGRIRVSGAAPNGEIEFDLQAAADGRFSNLELQPGILSADATGRALFAAGVFIEATVDSAFATGSIGEDRLLREISQRTAIDVADLTLAAEAPAATALGGIGVLSVSKAAGAGTIDITMPAGVNIRILDVWGYKTAAAGGAADTVQLQTAGGAANISSTISLNVADMTRFELGAGTLDDATWRIAGAGVLRLNFVQGTVSVASQVYVSFMRVA